MWTYQWKMAFNPGNSKEAQELSKQNLLILFFPFTRPPVFFNNVPIKICSIQNDLGIHLGGNMNLNHHIEEMIAQTSKGRGVIEKLNNTPQRNY